MVGSPLSRKCKMKSSICSEVKENQLEGTLPTSVLSVGRSSKKDAQILKKNSSHALSTKALCGTETESTRELSSAETKNRSSFSSPTISSSKKTYTEKQKVQVQQIKPRLKKDLESETAKTSQVKDMPAPRRPPLPVPKKIKKISAPPQVLKEITPIKTSIHQSPETARHTKTQSKAPVLQSKSQKAPTSQLPQKRILNQSSVRQSEPSKQYVRRSGTQKTSVPPQALAGKTRIPASIGKSKTSTSTKEPSRIRETYLGHEEPKPVHHIVWEGPEETFHSSGIICPLCENDISDMPDEYEDEYYDDIEPSVFPSVAILPCGHSFHAECLERITPEENSSDPPCFFCLSCMS
ncbi:uncharacterized protein LOC132602911 [Lycium barbarum]|uniref:uncharacterized protein LOC132602911 n=1 Tax=Lycium barbarum TaxID=112863 RepID=UPI00293EB306|nr:uncharacterized protein LOC132602911 [Lycium barbarum]XP_060171705.1 uncharacterized protein LOC132602911 [Lycium barbarum]XP_060171706.1 uncharacterized protein LOC132602911 [Lycium barbarum]XP_060171707.1 uncharacterized protein LOC132602911 [Lycium barbarum]